MTVRRRDPVPLADTLDALTLTAPPEAERPPIPQRHWERAVGTRIAERARPWRLERGVLHVRVSSSVWASELQLLSTEILAQLQGAGLDVRSLRFSVGKVERFGPPPPPPQVAPRPVPLPDDIAREVDAIDDDALRGALTAAASRWLGSAARAARRRT